MNRSALVLAALLAASVPVSHLAQAQVTHTYVFRDSMLPSEGAGPALQPVYNGTGTILTEGVGFVDGAYVTENISATACASSPTVRAWSFPTTGGLRHPNTTPSVITGSYSISMLLRYNPMDSGYARLVDFSNSTSDNGIYKLGDGVSFYPVGTYAAGSFVQDQDVFVTITREESTQLVSLFINGVAAGTYTDTGGLYAPAANTMYFLLDNTTGSAAISETDPGVIAYLQIRDTPMTQEEVTASLAAICATVACGDTVVTSDEQCDDGNVVPDDGCSSSCTIEPGWDCSGAPSVCVVVDAGTPDAGASDSGTEDAGLQDAIVIDTGLADVGGGDAGVQDAAAADAGAADIGGTDAALQDAAAADASARDAGGTDAAARDTGAADAATQDTRAGTDSARTDIGQGDSGGQLDVAVAPADASAQQVDAAPQPEEVDAGCSCTIVASGSRPLAPVLVFFLVLGLGATRRAQRRFERRASR
ncbi:MAG: DUF4215 domain-containing protein [Pseudomonadota bacterium]